MEHEILKDDLRKAKQYLAYVTSQGREQELEEGEIRNSSFKHYEDFRISKSIDDIGEHRSKSIRTDHESSKGRDRLREKDNSRQLSEAANDIDDLLDEGLEMLDNMGVPSSKLNPSLAARLGPEVNSVKAKVQSLVQSGKKKSPEKDSRSLSPPSSPHQQHSIPKHKSSQEEKENRVVEVLDSDQEEGEFQGGAPVEVIQIDDDDAPHKKSHSRRNQKRKSDLSPDVTIVEEKSHGPSSKHKSERKRKKSLSR